MGFVRPWGLTARNSFVRYFLFPLCYSLPSLWEDKEIRNPIGTEVLYFLTCAFNPHNASLVRLYGCNPEPIDLSGKLPTDSMGLSITACTCGVNFTFKSCANLPGL